METCKGEITLDQHWTERYLAEGQDSKTWGLAIRHKQCGLCDSFHYVRSSYWNVCEASGWDHIGYCDKTKQECKTDDRPRGKIKGCIWQLRECLKKKFNKSLTDELKDNRVDGNRIIELLKYTE